MQGLMMDTALTINSLIAHAAKFHGSTEIVTRTVEGPIARTTYAGLYARAHRLANVLERLRIGAGDRVASLAWNTHRHLEMYFAVSGSAAVMHMVNPRLFPDQIAYILNHAEDKAVFVDLTFVPVLEGIAGRLAASPKIVILTDAGHMPETALDALCYEDLMAEAEEDFQWPEIEENTASSLCYSSGTTGSPKGVLYSHRSTVLHAFATCSANALAISATDCVLPVVPMFHVNAWGIPYGAAMAGAKLVMPGAGMDGASVYELLDAEQVTFTAGVPTVWLMLLNHLKETGAQLPHLDRTVVGGSALPQSMIEAFEKDYGVNCIHAWGMTEMSPLGTVGWMKRALQSAPADAQMRAKLKQGFPQYGVDMKIVGDDGAELSHDGEAFGELCVRGPWVNAAYFGSDDEQGDVFDEPGWFRTGDVATIDANGYMEIVDRAKDVIKSGGEWISSIELENIAVGHPDVAEAAVIGLPHEKWGERPLLICIPADGAALDAAELLAHYDGKVAKWCIPNAVEIVDEIPHTATGKIQKTALRERFAGYVFGE